jgi:predicted nucleic acid-binding protein
MRGFLLDTNHLSSAMRPGSALRERLQWFRERGAAVGTCVPALCELEVGVQQVRDPATYRKVLARFLSRLRIWDLDPSDRSTLR